jgi:carbohydrate diacid regulator
VLNQEIAQRFIDRLESVLDYNINIMDSSGVIIASKDHSRIGTYHEVAHELILKGLSLIVVENSPFLPPGVRPGINLQVLVKGIPRGVIGVTGEAQDLGNIAATLKTSLETILEYEEQREEQQLKKDHRQILANALLFHDPTTKTNRNRILQDLGYAIDQPRIALVLSLPMQISQRLSRTIQESHFLGNQDILLQTPDGHPVVFKAIKIKKTNQEIPSLTNPKGVTQQVLTSVILQVEDWFQVLLRSLGLSLNHDRKKSPDIHPKASCSCGSLQTKPERYTLSYHHALWTQQNHLSENHQIHWYFDYIREYFLSQISETEKESVVELFLPYLEGNHGKQLLQTLACLESSNMRLKETAIGLGIHRNTLLQRIQRIREVLGLDPLNHPRDRVIAQILVYQAKRTENKQNRNLF